MANLELKIPHTLNQDEAKKRIISLINKTMTQYSSFIKDPKEEWINHTCKCSFKVMAFSINAIADILDNEIDLKIDLPVMLSSYKTRITEIVTEQVKSQLA